MDVFHFSIESGLHSHSIDFSLPSAIKLAVLVIKIAQGNLTHKYRLLKIIGWNCIIYLIRCVLGGSIAISQS